MFHFRLELIGDDVVVVNVLQFGELLVNLWSGKYTTVVPREFKSVLSKFAPQFAGKHSPHDVKDLHCNSLYRQQTDQRPRVAQFPSQATSSTTPKNCCHLCSMASTKI